MGGWEIEISDRSSDADITELRTALHEYNVASTGYRDGRDLSCFLRDEGRLVAGVDGFTWGGYARIDVLWVDEPLRRQGLGRALLAAAEAEARSTWMHDDRARHALVPGSRPLSRARLREGG